MKFHCTKILHAWKHLPELSLIADYSPIDTDLSTNLTELTVTVGTSFNLNCSAQANPPAKYRFYKEQERLFNSTAGGGLAVHTTSVSERIPQVTYTCTPFNDFGDGPTETITVMVHCKYIN